MRDAQGGHFHLLFGEADWSGCREWSERAERDVGPLLDDERTPPTRFELDRDTGSLRLAHRDPVLRRRRRGDGFPVDRRRGADRDRYRTWYWITEDRRGIVRLTEHAAASEPWWSVDDLLRHCQPAGTFEQELAPLPADAHLAGLAVTTGHWLVAGLVDDQGGLLLFDLHGGGTPTVLRWPGPRSVTPFDVAATADGGVLVLDRVRRTWWRLDRGLRLPALVGPERPSVFQPADAGGAEPEASSRPNLDPAPVAPTGHVLRAGAPHRAVDPVAIDEGPDGTVLVLDRPVAGPSAVLVLRGDDLLGRLDLTVQARDPERPDEPSFTYDVVGHDLAFVDDVPGGEGAEERPLPGPMLYVADGVTTQTLAFRLQLDPIDLDVMTEYLPMRRWEGRGLVDVGGQVYYDAAGRWVPLEPFGACSFERDGAFRTPTGFTAGDRPVPGQPFDSGIPGCVWHRLFLDADIPTGTSVRVGARASDDPQLLELLPFTPQPGPYLRGGGSELPWHDPWEEVRRPPSPRTGSWELLFQHVEGRYLQLHLSVAGSGRSTPSLRAIRAWFPRFSYVTAYLPGVYQEEDEPGQLLERLLANVEGYLTELESKIDAVPALLDPRATPLDAVDWLAGWVGLALEAAWSADRRRFLIGHADAFYRRRGTVGGLLSVLRLYLGCSLDEAVVLDPRARTDDPARLVELFRARGVDPVAVGDPTEGPEESAGAGASDTVAAAAHRFRVLVAERLPADRVAMVRRIVDLAKPAHVDYELRTFLGLFVVGEVRVGVDTLLGASARFVPIELDDTHVGAGYLSPDHPFEIADRLVSDRDRIGELAAL